MSTSALKTGYKKYFHKLLFFVISFLFFFSEQSQSQTQCSSSSISDRIVSGFHSTLVIGSDNNFYVWGQGMAGGDVSTGKIPLNPSPSTPIMGTIGGGAGGNYDQVVLLTSDGLWALGYNLAQNGQSGGVLPTSTSNFQKITQPSGGNSYGLPGQPLATGPVGIVPDDVASIFATYKTLLIVTKNDKVNANRHGQVWIITQTTQAVEANGGMASTVVALPSWKQVKINGTDYLTNITSARGQVSLISSTSEYYSAFMALAANGDVYTWGNTTYLGNNTAAAAQVYATKMILPTEANFSSANVPKMIGVTGGTKFVINSYPALPAYVKNTYYLLSNSGSLYALGDNSKRQCGDFSTSEQKGWVNVKSSSSTNFTNINFISVQEHTSGIPCASAITTDGELYTWGEDDGGMLARGTTATQSYNPGKASGANGTALFSEMGGHTLMYLKVGSDRFCYAGHSSNGSMGITGFDNNYTAFDCTATPVISICGSVPIAPAANSSTILASPNTIEANGVSTSTITVRLKTTTGVNLTTSGGIVVITTNAGTISSTIDNYNGTYTAILTSPIASATATLRFTVNGVLSSATTDVVFTPTVPPSTPGSITGAANVCPSTTGLVYSLEPVANATYYTWTVPTGWTITAGHGTNSITVSAGAFGQDGNVSVSAGNVIGLVTNTSALSILAVTVRPIFTSGEISSTGETICYGGIPAVIGSITASSGGNGIITYSWRSSADAYVSAIAGANLATYTPSAGLTSTTSYRRYANDGICNSTATVSAGTWTVTVLPAFATGTISSTGETICNGGTPTITIGSTTESSGGNGNIAYSWRSSADAYAVAIPSATLATYTPSAGLTSTTSYRRYANDGLCNTTATVSSGTWTVTVRAAFSAGTISSTGETICYGGTPTSTIGSTTASSGGNGVITYSWRSSADGYVAAIASATSATYKPPAGLTSTTSYRRYANDGLCNTAATVSTGTWTVTVRAEFSSGEISSTSETICNGGTPTLIVNSAASSGGNGSITYSWRSSADGYAIAIASATAATYTPPAGLTSTTSYRRYANDGICNTTATVSAGTWTVTVLPAFTTGTIGSTGETICNGGSPTITIGSTTASSGGNGVITYSWRSSADGYVAAIPSANAATYTPPAGLTSTTSYRRYANDGLCNATAAVSSGTWTVTVRAAFSAGEISSIGETICYGGNPAIIGSAIASSGGDASITYKWQANGVDIGTSNLATYDPPTGLIATTTYTRYAKDGTCNLTYALSSGTYTVTVRSNFSAGIISSTGETICYNGDPVIIGSAIASSGGDASITYKWQANGVDIGSSNSTTYDPPTGLTATTTYTRYAKDGTCNLTYASSSGTYTVAVRPNFSAGEISSTGETICNGGAPTITIGSTTASSGGNGNIDYSWRSSADGYVAAIPSATLATYTPPAGLTSTTSYRRYANDGLCNTAAAVSTGTWTVTVRAAFSAGEISATGETICYNGNPAIIGNTIASTGGDASIMYKWQANGVDIGTSNLATYDPPTGLTATTTYTRYAKDGTCNLTYALSSGTYTITVRPNFSAGTISSTGETICYNGDPVIIGSTTASTGGDASFTYKWQANGVDIGTSNSTTYDPPTGLTATTTYTRYAKDGTCNLTYALSTGTWHVLVNPLPTPIFTTQPGSTACPNADVTYTTEAGQTNYVWIVPGILNTDYSITSGGIGTTSNTVTLKWLTTGIKTVTINYTNSNSCTAASATSSTATTVSARPIPTFTTQPGATVCANTDVTYTTESGQTNYVWTGFGTLNTDYTITSGGIGTASNTVTLKWLTAGVKTVTINYTNVNSCTAVSATSSTATTVSARPVPTFTTQPGVAACASTDVTYTTEPGQSNYIWTISGAPYIDYFISGGSTTNNTITLKWLTAGIKTVMINYTNLNSCTAVVATSAIATTVSVRPTPTFTTQPGASACASTDVTYTTEPGQGNYVWTGFGTLNTDYTITSGGIGTASNTVTLKWLTAGVKTVTINYTNVNSCTAVSAVSSTATTVSARSTPTFITQPGSAACASTDLTYTTESGQANYIWIVPGTLNTDYTIVSGGIDNASNTVTLKWLTAGVKSVTINYTNSNNCNAVVAASSTATTVSARPIPAFTTQPGVTACPNADVTYTTEAGQTNYVWIVPGILNTDYSITSGGIGTTSNTVTLKWLTTGIKTVTINYTNSNSCTAASATSSTATTVSARPSPTFTTQPGATVCANTNVTYTTEPGQTNYVWTGFGTLNTDYTITSGGTAITNTVTLKWLTAGVKTVAINYSNSNNCAAALASSSSATTVNAAPIPTFIAQPGATACPNADVIYTTQSSQSNYIWTIPGAQYIDYFISGGSTTSNTVSLRWLTTGSKTVTINYTNSNSCIAESATSSTATVVNALPSPSFIAQPGANACPGIDVTYSTQSSQANYIWTVPGNLGTDYTITSGGLGATSNTVTLKWLTTGTKTVTINYSNSNNCTAASATSSTATSVNALPMPSFITQPGAAVCASASVTYTTEASQANYIWSFPGTLNTDYTIVSGGVISSNTVTLKWLTAGSKTATINYTNSNSCTAASATSSSATTVNALPTPSFTAEPGVTACPNADVVYTTQSSQTNYVWSVPGTLNTDYSITSGGIDNTSNTVTLKWLTTGTKTVTINYTNSNSCTAIAATSSLATVVNALPTPSFIVQPGVRECPNTDLTYSTQPSQGNYIWVVPGTLNTDYTITSGGIGNTSNTVTLKWLTSGSKTVTINYSNSNNCTAASATSSIATMISAINTVGIASSTPTICINTALTNITHLTTGATDITNSGIAGTNGLPPGVSASWASNTITISGTPSSSGIFNYSIPLTGGCGAITANGTIVVTANNVIALSSAAGTDNQTNCINTAITSIAYSTTGATGITFAGLPAGVTGSSTSNNVIISGTPSAAGVFNYTVALTGGCGVISAQGTIKVNALPVAAIISPSTTLLTCSTTAINLTATGGVSYLWTNGLGTAPTSSITAPGTYMVTVTDANICSSTASITITQNIVVPSSYAVTGTGSYCSGGAGLPIGLAGSQIGVQYQLQENGINSGIAIAGTGSAINFGNKLAAGTYSVIATNTISSCTNTMTGTALVKVLNLPVAGVITGATTLCAGMIGQTYSIASISNAATYNWVVPIGWTINSIQGDTLLTVTTGQVGQDGDIKLVPGNVCGLGSAATLAVAVLPMSTSSISSGSANQTICINTALANTVFSTTGATSASFSGLPAGVTGNWSNNAIRLSGSPTLAGSFIYTISLLGGCKIVDQTGEINVIPDNKISRSSAAATDSQNICIGNAITQIEYATISATGIIVTGLPAGLQAVFASNKITIAGTPTVVGVFNYTILLQGGCGQVTTNGTVSIHSLPTGTVTASNNGIICEGATVLLSATGGNNYQWYFNGNPIAGVATAAYSASLPGMYSVKLISDKGCANFVKNTPTLILNSAPVVGFNYDKYCINTPIHFTNTSTTNLSGPVSMLWDFGDNTSASNVSPTHSFLIEKTNIVKLTITPANCPLLAKSVSKNVQIEIPPKGIKYPTVYAVKNSNTPLTARASGKIYSWSPSTGLNNPAIKSPIFNYTGPSNYQVQITNDAGCIYSDSVNVMIFDQADFFVPKAFSPNNDGHNDKLLFVMPGIEKLAYFRIFNRWGNLVFETTNVNISWDGMFRGVAQPSESYSWFAEGISNLGNKIQRNGQILLLH